jgi:hypothetical protein
MALLAFLAACAWFGAAPARATATSAGQPVNSVCVPYDCTNSIYAAGTAGGNNWDDHSADGHCDSSCIRLSGYGFFNGTPLGIDLGAAGRTNHWAIFSLSQGVTITGGNNDRTGSFYDVNGNHDAGRETFYDVLGNIAVAGGGTLALSGASVYGDIWLKTGVTERLSGGYYLRGAFKRGGSYNPTLATGVTQALAASSAAALLPATSRTSLLVNGVVPAAALTNISLQNTAMAISGLVNATTVINLTDLVLSGQRAVLTLVGTSSSNYVINVSRYMSLAAGAMIQLQGGLQPQNVLFNVTGAVSGPRGVVTLDGGSMLNGIILAPRRDVTLKGQSRVQGQVIANLVSLSGSSQIRNNICSP